MYKFVLIQIEMVYEQSQDGRWQRVWREENSLYTYRVAINVREIRMIFEHTRYRKDTTIEAMVEVSIITMKIIDIVTVFFGAIEPLGYLMRRVTSCESAKLV